MTLHDSKKSLSRKIQFLVLVMIASIISILLHELGHCIFYWLQGIPAAMSLTKEFPLKDITVTQHAIGCAGGPLANIFQIVIAYWLYQRDKVNPRIKKFLAALILANAFYFIVISLSVLLKRSGGELEDAANLVGLSYLYVVGLFAILTCTILYLWVTRNGIKTSVKNGACFLVLLIAYFAMLIGLWSIDSELFWHKFPTIQIDDGRLYNEHLHK